MTEIKTPIEPWKIETNDRYGKIVNSIISLATAAMILPALFLREFLGVPKEKALAPFLTWPAYIAWGCLGCSVFLGLFYSWISVKWIKQAWGQKIVFPENCLESIMDTSFVLMMLLFIIGIASSVWFFATVRVI